MSKSNRIETKPPLPLWERDEERGAGLAHHLALLTHHLARNWPEYLIEAWALGTFMISACVFTILFEHPSSAVNQWITNADVRRGLQGIAMGLTAIALIYSPWGKRSGAHMNPAVTLTFLRLGKTSAVDAGFYIGAQLLGGTLGVLLVALAAGDRLSSPSVNFALTQPQAGHARIAFGAEVLISFFMMSMVLRVSSSNRLKAWTGVFAGLLVATFITFEAPLSGMSMNPARSFASALPSNQWMNYWIYVIAPIVAMQLAALVYVGIRGRDQVACAKLQHPLNQRCIHCGYEPSRKLKEAS